MEELELNDIQGIVISGYGHLPWSAYLFLQFQDPAAGRRWIEGLSSRITTARWQHGNLVVKPMSAINLALTAAGLRKLGMKPETLNTFAQEFEQGMAAGSRSRRIGDKGASDPAYWEFGGREPPAQGDIHALLILQATQHDQDNPKLPSLNAMCVNFEHEFAQYAIEEVVSPRHVLKQFADGKEHFGFRDSIAQPMIAGSPNTRSHAQKSIKAGEFILGYQNEYGVLPQSPVVRKAEDTTNLLHDHEPDKDLGEVKDFGRNGTYLVLRKLAQDVAAFRRFLREQCETEDGRRLLAAKFVGRWEGGAPLVLADHDDPTLSTENDFGYAETDFQGLRCPMGAHIRRANPRDAFVGSAEESVRVVNRHRLIRRGVPYGPRLAPDIYQDDGVPRGLLFICLNADIERQFELVQQDWINSPKFGGAYTDADVVAGANDPASSRISSQRTFTIPAEPVRRRILNIPRFITTRGGAYFFLPSIRGLRFLGAHQPE